MVTHHFEYQLPLKIDVRTGDIGGPSAGLMLSLGILDALRASDSTRGQRVAGTGTISLDGTVGPVGEVELKVRTAEKAGARYFLVPTANGDSARASAARLQVLPVGNLKEALAALARLEVIGFRA